MIKIIRSNSTIKDSICVFIITVFIIALFYPCFDSVYKSLQQNMAKDDVVINEQVAMFPRNLRIVEQEAFAGTSLNKIIFEYGLLKIESKAFSDIDTLREVFIPESTEYIGYQAFYIKAVLYGVHDSYVEEWASENCYRFIVEDIWSHDSSTQRVSLELLWIFICFACPSDHNVVHIKRRIYEFVKSMRPQDRSELYPINYRFP